jgi:hypothetical protein
MFRYLFIIIICPFLAAQNLPGARQNALCNSDLAVSDDIFALFGNPAGLPQIGWPEGGIYYSPAPFGLTELANGYMAYGHPAGRNTFSLGVMTYGYDLYRENKFLIGWSRRVTGDIFIGTSLNYQLVSIKNYGAQGSLYINLGTLAYFTPELRFGFDITNLNRASLGNEKDQIPVLLNMGLSYTYSEILILSIAMNKDLRYRPGCSGGVEYLIRDILFIRSGIGIEPFQYSAGTGIHLNHFSFDYAFFLHRELGITHQVSLIYSLKEYRNRTSAVKDHLREE